MKISLNWIKDYVDISGIDTDWLINKITTSTAEVEEVIFMGKDINNVVCGKIIDIKSHPHSEKLRIIRVWTGDEEVQSLCGAPNIYMGMIIPFAKCGGSIKGINLVEPHILNGIESNGIACSERELGISDNHDGVLDLLNEQYVGRCIKDIIPIDDIIIDIDNKSLTNRPDLWGHYGIAREIAAITKRELKPVDCIPETDLKCIRHTPLDIMIEDREKCLRYCAIAIDDIRSERSPLNIITRLHYCGLRPINLIVDLTNYVMIDLGLPLHAFDKEKMCAVRVKSFDEVIKFTTLDDVEREIPQNTLMICNEDRPMTIAGILGGMESGISSETTSILLEAAVFEGVSIRKSASRLGIRTDASARYEKFLDTSLCPMAAGRYVRLLSSINPNITISSPMFDEPIKSTETISLVVEHDYVEKYFGEPIEKTEIMDILNRLEFKVTSMESKYSIEVPTFRATKDVTSKADIIEEILRVYGYDKILTKPLSMISEPVPYNPVKSMEYALRDLLVKSFNFSEAQTYSWYDDMWLKKLDFTADTINIINTDVSQYSRLRTNIIPNLLQLVHDNRKSWETISIFEIGRTYIKDAGGCTQHKHLGAILHGNQDMKELFLKLKGICSEIISLIKNIQPGYKIEDMSLSFLEADKQLKILCGGIETGYIGIPSPGIIKLFDSSNLVVLDLDIDLLTEIKGMEVKYSPVSKYPETYLDFSILSPRTLSYSSLRKITDKFTHPLIVDFEYVATYEGQNIPKETKSTTLRMKIGSQEKTLSLEEINLIKEQFISFLIDNNLHIR